MTLRARLLLSTCILSLAITLGLSLLVRRTWEQTERSRFDDSFQRAVSEVRTELHRQTTELKRRLAPLCAHDTAVDSALLGLQNGTLKSRLLPVRLALKEQQKALALDELALVTNGGVILAGTARGRGANLDAELTTRLSSGTSGASIRREPDLALEAFCLKGDGDSWIALVAARQLEPVLEAAALHQDLQLSMLDAQPRSKASADEWSMAIELEDAAGLTLVARRSRLGLSRTLSQLDLSLVSAALAMLAIGLGVALLLSRGLSQPVVEFAERTRRAIGGRPEPLPVTGGPELEQAARAFNQTLEDLRRLQERLKLTERIAARRDLARQVAHEIKNPLMPIATSVETLQKLRATGNPAFEQFVDEALSTIASEVRRMTKLVANFAAYGRLPEPHPEPFDLRAQIERLAELHRELGATIEVTTEGNHRTWTVIADRDQITQALTNLIKNAIEAVRERPLGEVWIHLGSEPAESRTRRPDDPAGSPAHSLAAKVDEEAVPHDREMTFVTVWDNGAGVAPELVGSLMEPYRTSKAGGTGLGLAITHRIAVEHGGDLTYQTDHGARFTLSIPRHGPHATARGGTTQQ